MVKKHPNDQDDKTPIVLPATISEAELASLDVVWLASKEQERRQKEAREKVRQEAIAILHQALGGKIWNKWKAKAFVKLLEDAGLLKDDKQEKGE